MGAALYSLLSTWEMAGGSPRTVLSDYLNFCARENLLAIPKGTPDDKRDELVLEKFEKVDLSPWLPWNMTPERKVLLSKPFPDTS